MLVQCPGCHKKLSVKEELAGKKVKCPGCGQVIAVPAPVAAPSESEMQTLPPEPFQQAAGQAPAEKAPRDTPTPSPSDPPDATHAHDDEQPAQDVSLTDFLAPAEAADELGLLGKYRILQVLGHGGMGVVFKAEDPRLDRICALKTMLPEVARKPAMKERFPQIDWRVTAGNSSQINDASSAVLVMSAEAARAAGLTPIARVHEVAVVGDDPIMMLTGVIPATRKVLERAGLTLDDIDLFEVNEAFASVVLAWQRETGADLAKVNVSGGAIALGHPLGATGARLLTTLLHALVRTGGRYGMATMCEGGGQANVTIVERL